MLRRRGKREDGAKTHMLEVMVTLSIMVAAVANVLTFESSTSSFSPEQADLQNAVEHFLAIMEDTPQGASSKCDGATWLSHIATEALAGEHDFLDQRRSTLLQDKEVNLYIDNGRGKYPLLTEFGGYANAGAQIDWDPNATWALPIPQVSGVGGQESLVIDTPAIRNSEIVRMRGEAIEATLTTATTQGALAREVYATGVTALPRADYVRAAVQDILWTHPSNETGTLIRAPVGAELIPGLHDPMRFRLWLTSAQGVVIPTATSLNIVLPPGWMFTGEELSQWSNTSTGDETRGWRLTFTATTDIPSPAEFFFQAQAPLAPTRPFDVIQAQFGNGSLGQSPFVVQYTAPTERGLPQSLYLTTPYPVSPGADATFGVVFANGGATTKVKQLDITVPGGYDLRHNQGKGASLFANVAPVALNGTSPDGSWSWIDAKHLRWTASGTGREVAEGTAAQWIFKARITSDNVGNYTAIEGPSGDGVVSRVYLDNSVDATSLTLGPNVGVLRQRIAPDSLTTLESDGYPWEVATSATEHEYVLRIEDNSFHVEAEGNYTVVPGSSDLVQMDSAITNSTTRVSQRLVPLGGVLRIATNLESMVSELAANGVTSSTIRVEVYSPFSRGCKPTLTREREASAMPLAGLPDMDVYDELGIGAPNTYLASDDGSVYRVDATGAAAWSRATDSSPILVEAGPSGPSSHAVIVGELSGNVTQLDVATGAVLWSTHVAPAEPGLPTEIVFLKLDPTTGRVLASTSSAIEILSPTGVQLARHANPEITDPIQTVASLPDGGVAFLTTRIIGRLDENLGGLLATPMVGGSGLTIAPAGIFTTNEDATFLFDPDTLDPVAQMSTTDRETAAMAAPGDATGDGVPDHLVVLPSLRIEIHDGTTGERTVRALPVATLRDIGVELPSIPEFIPDPSGPTTPDISPVKRTMMYGISADCPEAGEFPTYQDGHLCMDPEHPGNAMPTPLAIRAEKGRVLFAYMVGPVPRLYGWHEPSGLPFVDKLLSVGSRPLDVWLGPWSGAVHGYGYAGSAGTAGVWDELGVQKWERSVSEFVGEFEFNVGIPLGGFYGAHLVKMTLAWEDPIAGPREAHMLDWFHVVDVDGTPITAPHYQIEMSVRDPFMPMRES